MLVEIPDLFFDDTVLGQPIFLSQVIISSWLVSPKQSVYSQYPGAETAIERRSFDGQRSLVFASSRLKGQSFNTIQWTSNLH